jgi:hypothetical protein
MDHAALWLAGAVAVGALWAPSGARAAANVVWNLAGGGNWDTTSNNWTGGSPNPSRYVNGDNATFSNTAGGTINVASGITPGTTTVSATSGTYTFAGSGIQNGFELHKTGAGQLDLSSLFNSFAVVIVDNAGSATALGSGAHLTLDCATGPALLASIDIGIPTATGGNVARVNLNRSDQIVDNGIVYFDSPAPQWAYFSLRGNNETIANIVSNNTGGVVENGNYTGAISTDGTLTLAPTSNSSYTYTGIIRDADVLGGSGKLNIAVNGSGAQVLGAGGTYSYTGTTTVDGGTLTIAAGATIASTNLTVSGSSATLNVFGSVPTSASVSSNSGGVVFFAGNTSTAAFTRTLTALSLDAAGTAVVQQSSIDAYPAVLKVTTFTSTSASSALDLLNNELISTGAPTDAKALIVGGNVITISSGKALGYGDAGSGQYEIRPTLLGDTDLNGNVNVADLGNLATNFNRTDALWVNGDFDYNGNVNVADLGDLTTNFGQSLSSTGNVAAIAATPVPEPSSIMLTIAAAAGRCFHQRRGSKRRSAHIRCSKM